MDGQESEKTTGIEGEYRVIEDRDDDRRSPRINIASMNLSDLLSEIAEAKTKQEEREKRRPSGELRRLNTANYAIGLLKGIRGSAEELCNLQMDIKTTLGVIEAEEWAMDTSTLERMVDELSKMAFRHLEALQDELDVWKENDDRKLPKGQMTLF